MAYKASVFARCIKDLLDTNETCIIAWQKEIEQMPDADERQTENEFFQESLENAKGINAQKASAQKMFEQLDALSAQLTDQLFLIEAEIEKSKKQTRSSISVTLTPPKKTTSSTRSPSGGGGGGQKRQPLTCATTDISLDKLSISPLLLHTTDVAGNTAPRRSVINSGFVPSDIFARAASSAGLLPPHVGPTPYARTGAVGSGPYGHLPSMGPAAPSFRPTFPLPSFSGAATEFPSFMEMFSIAVDSHAISDVEKLYCLQQCLKGPAKAVLENVPLVGENYAAALDTLRRRYGDTQTIIRDPHLQLAKIPPASSSVESARNTFEKIIAVTRQLQNLGEDTSHMQILMPIESKLTKFVLEHVLQVKTSYNTSQSFLPPDSRVPWGLNHLAEAVNQYLLLKEQIEDMHKTAASGKPQKGGGGGRDRGSGGGRPAKGGFPPTGVFFTDATKDRKGTGVQAGGIRRAPSIRKQKVIPKTATCFFCAKNHWASECSAYPTLEDRSKRARELQLCFRCLMGAHSAKECTRKKPCIFCSGEHNSAFCKQKIPSAKAKKSSGRPAKKPTP